MASSGWDSADRAAYGHAVTWRTAHARPETIELICDLIRHGYARVLPGRDPCRAVEQALGHPLSPWQAAVVVATILGPDPDSGPPPDRHLRSLENLLREYGEDFAPANPSRPDLRALAPWHLGVGYGAGWQRVGGLAAGWDGFWDRCYDPRAATDRQRHSVLFCLVDSSVRQANRMTVAAQAIGRARLDEGSRCQLSRWICARMVANDCVCGFHDGRRWTCSAGADGVGTRCGTMCCRHGFEAWARADPNNNRVRDRALPPLGLQIARYVGTAMTGLQKDFRKGLFVQGIIRDDLGLTWELRVPGGDLQLPMVPLGHLRVRVGPVEFRQCREGGGLYEGDRCPDHEGELFVPSSTPRVIREHWIFALEMHGPPPLRFFYEEHLLLPCSGSGCRFALDPETQWGRDCACGRPWTAQFLEFPPDEEQVLSRCRRVWRKQTAANPYQPE